MLSAHTMPANTPLANLRLILSYGAETDLMTCGAPDMGRRKNTTRWNTVESFGILIFLRWYFSMKGNFTQQGFCKHYKEERWQMHSLSKETS